MQKQVIPAILTQSVSDLMQKINSVAGLAKWVHVDILDNTFIARTSVQVNDIPPLLSDMRLSVHLMVGDPIRYLADCEKVGVDQVIFHYEAVKNHEEVIKQIGVHGMQRVCALNRETPIDVLFPFIDSLDGVLLMGVPTGFGGQDFIEATIGKVKELSIHVPDHNIIVDGGISVKNISELHRAGAISFVVGSDIFDTPDVAVAFKELSSKLE